MDIGLLIFDFDGVVADSEALACGVAAAYATELGFPMDADEGIARFMGKRSGQVRAIVEEHISRTVPEFETELLRRTLDAFAADLEPVAGVADFLRRHADIPRCIASSSSHARLRASLDRLGFTALFEGRIFSADDVARGKPFPDLLLHAAAAMGVDRHRALVIEDSPAGVAAGKAASMTTIGLLAGSHQRAGSAQALREAGADHVVGSFAQLSALIAAG